MSLTGCSILPQMAAPTANFGLGLYNADSYYSKECLWYEPVQLSAETKKWITKNKPTGVVVKDLAKIARNNDLYKEVCK